MGRRINASVSDGLQDALARGEPFRRKLPEGGQIHIDRELPFLFVYRQPPKQEDAATDRLIRAEASFLIAPGDREKQAAVSETVRQVVSVLSAKFGAFLLIEISARSDDSSVEFAADWRPSFRIEVSKNAPTSGTVEVLESHLQKVRVFRKNASVEVDRVSKVAPHGMPPLLTARESKELGCAVLGLEVLPIYRDEETGVFPLAVRSLRRQLSRAVRRSVHRFAVAHTGRAPASYLAFGRRRLTKPVFDVDQRLAEICDSFDFLLHVTPVNADAAWRTFQRGGFEKEPRFLYRPLPVDPILLKRKLFGIPIERLADPALEQLFRDKQLELERKLTMFSDRETPSFLYGSLQLYGLVSPELVNLAESILARVPAAKGESSKSKSLDAEAFARLAVSELERYRESCPELSTDVEIRDDIVSVMVSSGKLLVGRSSRVAASRVNAVLQHEIGTHVVTYVNGKAQPLRILYDGLAGYDELQEGLAVLAEYLVGELTAERLRVLAGRVIAARDLIEGKSFVETFHELCDKYRFARRRAFQITMRVYRGGGLTKDAVYLRGFVEILEYVRSQAALDDLLIGKISSAYLSVLNELKLRGVLSPPMLRPWYLEDQACLERLEAIRAGTTVLDIVEEVKRKKL